MCYVLYIGSDSEMSLIAPEHWGKNDNKFDEWISQVKPFCIEELKDHEKAVRRRFQEKYVLYAGSYTGCGCGYAHCLIDEFNESDPKELEASLRSRKALYDYVIAHGITTLYGCWSGDEHLESEREMEIEAKTLLDRTFDYPERIKLIIKSNTIA